MGCGAAIACEHYLYITTTREASGHTRDRDLSHDVTPDPQTRADARDVVAGAASPLLQHKSFIPLGRHLRPLGPHNRRAVRTAEQEPGFAGNVRPDKPGVGLGPEQRGARLDDVRPPGLFRLGRGLNARQALRTHIAEALTHPFDQRLTA